MHELRTWLWQYTDAFGNRVVSRWRMTEHEAQRYREPLRLHHTLRVAYDNIGRVPAAAISRICASSASIRPIPKR